MRKKLYVRLLSLLMAVVLLCGCGKSSAKEAQDVISNGEYNFSIYDNNGRSFTADEIAIQNSFNAFLNALFIDAMESSYISLLYTVENPAAIGININNNITWGDYSLEAMQAGEQQIREAYDKLITFDYDSLDYEGQLIFDTLKLSLESDMIGCKYWYFAENFSPLDGIQTSIPIMLAEIEFSSKEDIDNYLILVNDTKRLIDELLLLEKYRSENYKIFLTDNAADNVIEQCNEFINAEENLLITTFDARINDLSFLSDEEKNEYKNKNKAAIETVIIPAFKSITDTLPALKGTRIYNGLCEYENGKEYYSYLVNCNSNSHSSLDTLLSLTKEYMENAAAAITTAGMSAVYEAYYPKYPCSTPLETLDYFAEKLKADFPAPATTKYEVKYVPKSLEASSSPAFYIIPPIDNIDKNIIYINGSDKYADEDLYATLSHEGFPGHLYQCTYFNSLNPNPIRSVLNFTGYNEGYAMYAERYAYDYSGLSKSAIDVLKANDIYGYGLYSYIDLQVNYAGWDYEQVCSYMNSLGYNETISSELYSISVNDPCVYHRYFLGLVEILELMDNAKALLGDYYSNINFNKFILEIGPTYFSIIKDRMTDWSKRILAQ